MTDNRSEAAPLQKMIAAAAAGLRNSGTTIQNNIARLLPGERPEWIILNLSGSYPVRKTKRKLLSTATVLGNRPEASQEELESLITRLLAAPWLKGVLVRLEDPEIDWATAFALRRQLQRLKDAGRELQVTTSQLNGTTLYLASIGDRLIMPEGADLNVHGMAMSSTYRADFLKRFGIRVEKAAIREYKSAMDDLARSEMSPGDRKQWNAILDSFHGILTRDVARGRETDPATVGRWIDEGITSASRAQAAGMIDRLAYEDEFINGEQKPLASASRFLTRPLKPAQPGRVAFVSLDGAIIPGNSRQLPIPIPFLGGKMAGSESVVRALRAAGKDRQTKAIVFHVESGGGSPLASDLIWREVSLLAKRMPVVAVMGSVAGSGGYYVLTHATKIIAAPMTITGSIGVVNMKFVLEEFNSKYGFNTEILKRGRFADLSDSSRPWDESELAFVNRYMREVYDRFVERVADGRKIAAERVNELGRGRIWSGEDALAHGLIDELGDAASAVSLAKQLAGLPEHAAVWTVDTPRQFVLPIGDDPRALQRAIMPLLRERALLAMPHAQFRAG